MRPGIVEEADQAVRRGNGVTRGAVALPLRNLHVVVPRNPIQRPFAQLRQHASSESHCAQATSGQLAPRGTRDFSADKSPIEGRVVRHEHVAFEDTHHFRAHVAEGRLVPHHVPRDVRESRDEWGNGPLRIDERLVHVLHATVAHRDDGDLGDPITRTGPPTGGLHVHHRKGECGEKRFVVHRLHPPCRRRGLTEAPGAVVRADEAGMLAKQRHRHVVRDRARHGGKLEHARHERLRTRRASPEEVGGPFHQERGSGARDHASGHIEFQLRAGHGIDRHLRGRPARLDTSCIAVRHHRARAPHRRT